MKLTRRAMASALTAAVVAAQAPPKTAVTPEAELEAARNRVRANNVLLTAQSVPMSMEPAFQFKA